MSIEQLDKGAKETVFQSGVEHWLKKKHLNETEIKRAQGGTRDQNLRGDTMDGFRDVIIEFLRSIGVDEADIYSKGNFATLAANLPSFFRASKNWDVVVCKHAHHKTGGKVPPKLVAAIEFKSQHKSIGNNQNNRIEESIGNAVDFWQSYDNLNFSRLLPRPWLGYLFIGTYAEGDENKSVEIRQPLIPSDPGFGDCDKDRRVIDTVIDGPSYAQRYKIFLQRMIAKKLYDGACFLVTHESIAAMTPNYRVLFPELSGECFLDGLRRHIVAYYPD